MRHIANALKGYNASSYIVILIMRGYPSCYLWENSFSLDLTYMYVLFVSACSYETGQSVGGAKTGETREKPPGTTGGRYWLVSHVPRVELEPTPDTAVRCSNG